MMDIIDFGSEKYKNTKMCTVIGAFDGLHKGHLGLIKKAREISDNLGSKLMLITFKNNPKFVINPELKEKPLILLEQSIKIYEENKVDILNLIDFSLSFSRLSSVEFFNKISAICSLVAVVVGTDFRCGYQSKDFDLVKIVSNLSPSILTYRVDLFKNENNEIYSSTLIRNLLRDSKVSLIQGILGRPYSLILENNGSTILDLDSSNQMQPSDGSYLVYINGKEEKVHLRANKLYLNNRINQGKVEIIFIKELNNG